MAVNEKQFKKINADARKKIKDKNNREQADVNKQTTQQRL